MSEKKIEDKDAAAPPPAPKSKKMLFIIIGLVIVLAGAGGAYFFMQSKTDGTKEAEHKVEEHQYFLALDTFTVNLTQDPDQMSQYLQIVMSLQDHEEKDLEVIKDRMPEARSRILFLLSGKKASEISTLEGKNSLIEQIIEEINKPFAGSEKPQTVSGVFFTAFLIQ